MKIIYNAKNRKALVQAISEFTGEKSKYLGMPSAAYQVSYFTITRDGNLEFNDRSDSEEIKSIIDSLAGKGFIAENQMSNADASSDSIQLVISAPISHHTGISLRNLVNLIYSRGQLISKATGGNFSVEHGLTDHLATETGMETVEAFLSALTAYNTEHETKGLIGIEMTSEEVKFTGFPQVERDDAGRILAFQQLAAAMVKQALTQKRIQAKTVDDTSEKYALRVWLLRLGMKGDAYKTTRKLLLNNLSGSAAFSSADKAQAFLAKEKAKREAARTASGAVDTEAADYSAQSGEQG